MISRQRCSSLIVALGLLFAAAQSYAQTAIDPSGHWEGAVEGQVVRIELAIDLMKRADGTVFGTIDLPADDIAGLPLVLTLDGRNLRFHVREDQPTVGTIAEDGSSFEGRYNINGFDLPVRLTRTGPARIQAAAPSPAVNDNLVGKWVATIGLSGSTVRLVLTVANHPDGTATAALTNLSDGGLTVPATSIRPNGTGLNLVFGAIKAAYVGSLLHDEMAIVGTFQTASGRTEITWQRETP